MEQHPVPQNISSYEFRLVGDMTLKQFLQLAGGIVLAFIFFRLPIPVILKYPLVFVSAVTGAAMAFLPISGRPFTAWLTAFIRAVYSPTQYLWVLTPIEVASPPIVTPPPSPPQPSAPGFISFFKSRFARKASPPVTTAPAPPLPQPTVVTPPQPTPPPAPDTPPPAYTFPVPSPLASSPPPPASPAQTEYHPFVPPPPPAQPSPPVPPAPSPPPAVPQPAPTLAQPKPPVKIIDVPLTPAGPAPIASPPPPASQASPLPSIPSPDQPNVLVGQVNDLTGSPLSGVTLEIVDSTTGIPARALRTNRLGQFQIAIPLPPGSYVINAEKEGLLFDPVSVTVANSVIPPIAITAKPAISSQLIPDPLALSP